MNKIISGKVRDIYEIDSDHLVIVTTDRISAFDVILSKPVMDKGKVLNALSLFWFDYTKDIIKNHIISDKLSICRVFPKTGI
jgi:phosphoribosylaminoimidazole-succinocarboxamide synthase